MDFIVRVYFVIEGNEYRGEVTDDNKIINTTDRSGQARVGDLYLEDDIVMEKVFEFWIFSKRIGRGRVTFLEVEQR